MSKLVEEPENRATALSFYTIGFVFTVVGISTHNFALLAVGIVFLILAAGYVPVNELGDLLGFRKQNKAATEGPKLLKKEEEPPASEMK